MFGKGRDQTGNALILSRKRGGPDPGSGPGLQVILIHFLDLIQDRCNVLNGDLRKDVVLFFKIFLLASEQDLEIESVESLEKGSNLEDEFEVDLLGGDGVVPDVDFFELWTADVEVSQIFQFVYFGYLEVWDFGKGKVGLICLFEVKSI